jgi:hypothetical protein
MEIQVYAEDVKLKADNLFCLVGSSTRPAVNPPCHFQKKLGHSVASDAPG